MTMKKNCMMRGVFLMNNNKLNPERYLGYKSLVKYDKLTEFVNLYYRDNNSNNIDLYIDISSMECTGFNILTQGFIKFIFKFKSRIRTK